MNEKIDFVILWVDDTDTEWQKEKERYKPKEKIANTANRYRDWETLKYWFRGVEKFAPWVNNIFFVTYGHLPKWLNLENTKLKIVKHEDFMENEYLPTFNSNAIELNLHKIKGLEKNFVLFNDDVYIIKPVKENDFFEENLPKEEFAENTIIPDGDIFPHTIFNNIEIINKYYDKNIIKKNNKGKYYNIKYGKNNIRTLLLKPYKKFVGIYNPHICTSFKKEYFDKIWSLEKEKCENTSKSKFRNKENITQYLIRYFQLLDGNFIPRSNKFGKLLEIKDNKSIKNILLHIEKQKEKIICINDNDINGKVDFEVAKKKINKAFEKILPEKSTYER